LPDCVVRGDVPSSFASCDAGQEACGPRVHDSPDRTRSEKPRRVSIKDNRRWIARDGPFGWARIVDHEPGFESDDLLIPRRRRRDGGAHPRVRLFPHSHRADRVVVDRAPHDGPPCSPIPTRCSCGGDRNTSRSIYNDAYRPILGTKHPWALSRPVSECWAEIWHILRPLIDTPFPISFRMFSRGSSRAMRRRPGTTAAWAWVSRS